MFSLFERSVNSESENSDKVENNNRKQTDQGRRGTNLMANIFAERFKIIYDESSITPLQKFADTIDLSRQTCDTYIGTQQNRKNPLPDDRMPDGNTLLKISRYFDVSTDWLLGVSPVDRRNPSSEVKDAVAALGISEKAAERIIDPDIYGSSREAISHLLEDRNFEYFIQSYKSFLNSLKHYHANSENAYEADDDGNVTLPPGMAADFFMTRAVDHLRAMLEQEKCNQAVGPASDTEVNYLKG